MDLKKRAANIVEDGVAVYRAMGKKQVAALAEISLALAEILKAGRRVFLMGNGGSAADAQHMAGELVGRFKQERRGFAAQALTTDTSIITALANDYGYQSVFAKQVEALVNTGDAVIGISTSGNSANVIGGLAIARESRSAPGEIVSALR